MKGACEICGEHYDTSSPRSSVADIGEFYDPDEAAKAEVGLTSNPFPGHVIAHAECGINAGLEIA